MITLRKLEKLQTGARLRKIARMLLDFERNLSGGKEVDHRYVEGVLRIAAETLPDTDIPIPDGEGGTPGDVLLRVCNTARHRILRALGTEPAEWDLYNPADDGTERVPTLPVVVYLDDIRSPFNVGSIFRTASAFGVQKIYLSPDTPTPEHRRVLRSSMGATDVIAWQTADGASLDGPVFALETGGTPVDSFRFPPKGTVILGSEELGVCPQLLETARSSAGVVSIPLVGRKASLNVGVSFGILMQHWLSSLPASES